MFFSRQLEVAELCEQSDYEQKNIKPARRNATSTAKKKLHREIILYIGTKDTTKSTVWMLENLQKTEDGKKCEEEELIQWINLDIMLRWWIPEEFLEQKILFELNFLLLFIFFERKFD